MLLELMNFVQQLFGALEDLFHGLVTVTVFEAFAAPAGANVVAPNPGEVQRALKRWTDLTGRARCRGLGRLRWFRDILWLHGIGRCASPRLAGLCGGSLLRSRR